MNKVTRFDFEKRRSLRYLYRVLAALAPLFECSGKNLHFAETPFNVTFVGKAGSKETLEYTDSEHVPREWRVLTYAQGTKWRRLRNCQITLWGQCSTWLSLCSLQLSFFDKTLPIFLLTAYLLLLVGNRSAGVHRCRRGNFSVFILRNFVVISLLLCTITK